MPALGKNGGQIRPVGAPCYRVVVGLIPAPEPGLVQTADHGYLDGGPFCVGQAKVDVGRQLGPYLPVSSIALLGRLEPGETACGQD